MTEKRLEIVLPEPCRGERTTWLQDGNNRLPIDIGRHETLFYALVDHINELHERIEKLEVQSLKCSSCGLAISHGWIGVGETVEKPKEKE